MAYLARIGKQINVYFFFDFKKNFSTEGTNCAEISWKFDFSKADMVIKNYKFRCDKKTYEDAEVNVNILTEDGRANPVGSSSFTINVSLCGGKGDCSWQHSQLFRQSLTSEDFPFELSLEFQ